MNRPTRRQRLAITVLLVLSAAFVTLDYRGGSFDGMRSGAETVFGPVQRGFSAVIDPVGRFFSGLANMGENQDRIDDLEQQNEDLTRRLQENGLDTERADELDRLELLAGVGQYRIVPGVVVSFGPSLGFEWTVTLDIGSRDGVKEGMTVVNGDGLVGRVKRVGKSTCVVILAVDPGSSVGVRQEGTKQLGLVTGNGLGALDYSPLDPRTKVEEGDRLVTGPYGSTTYAPGVPVGEVSEVKGSPGDRSAKVDPYVEATSLDLVGVVLAVPRADPRDSLLPPRPDEERPR